MTLLVRVLLAFVLAAGFGAQAFAQTDPLPSWNDNAAKAAINEFVHATTDKSSPKFVPPDERIATFDQDGTLWVEHPMYTQVVYCLDRVPAVVKAEAGARRKSSRSRPYSSGQSGGDREALDEGSRRRSWPPRLPA